MGITFLPIPQTQTLSSQGPEKGAYIFGQQVRLLQSGKVTAPGHWCPALHVIGALSPLPRRAAYFLRKESHGAGHLNPFTLAQAPGAMLELVV